MSAVADSMLLDSVHQLLHLPETLERLTRGPADGHRSGARRKEEGDERGWGSVPVDIMETDKSYSFFFDVPGLSKTDIQVTLEDGNILVVKSNTGAKRKRDEAEEEGCKYLRLERKTSTKFQRKIPAAGELEPSRDHCEGGEWGVDGGGGEASTAAGGEAEDGAGEDWLRDEG